MGGKRNKALFICLIILVAVVYASAISAAQEPSFRLDLDNLNLQKGVSTRLTLSMINAQGAEVVEIEGLAAFDVLSRSQSTSISIVNGKSTHQFDWFYTIMPKEAGEFTLKAKVKYNGKIYESNELTVTVSEIPDSGDKPEGDLFIRTSLSKDEIYLGEKVVLTYELYTRYSIEDVGFMDYTAIDGAVAKEMPVGQQRGEYVYLGGIRYAKYVIKQLIIDPIKTGSVTIPAFNVQVNVITDGFGGFGGFFSSTRPMYIRTQAKELTVTPLPLEGRPKDFSGVVGELQLEGSYTREEVEFGDSLSLLVKASGSCNLDGLKRIFTGNVPGFAVYETQKNAAESVKDGQYYAEKEFEVIMVPQKTGTIEVAPVAIAYFNPVTGKYERAEIPGTTIEITGEMPVIALGGGENQPTARETVAITQVNYLDASDGYVMLQINKQVLFWVLVGICVLIVLIILLVWIVSSRRQQDATLKVLYKQMMAAEDVSEVYDLFNEMIKHCFGVSLKASPVDVVRRRLPEEIAEQVVGVVGLMESENRILCDELKGKVRGIYLIIESGLRT